MVANSRKKREEVFGNTNIGDRVEPLMDSFTFQPQPSQLVDLSILHNHQLNVVSFGLWLACSNNNTMQQQNQQQQQQLGVFSLLSEDFIAQIKHQRGEIDQFL